jgi:hypothetical protein
LRFAIAFALKEARKLVRGLREGAQRRRALSNVQRLQQHDAPWRLSDRQCGRLKRRQRPGWAGNHVGFYPFPTEIADQMRDDDLPSAAPTSSAYRMG